jgi:3-hydroxyisobutyryl-CoA hydrolase
MATFRDPSVPRELPSDEPDDVLFSSLYGVRTVELNRPKKLNSLNGSMARKIIPRLREWEKSQMANVVIMSGAGTKAFCAGGDVAELAQQNNTPEGQRASSDYFALEYQLDHLIAIYSKPYIAIMDGITMGGGVGLSVHAPFRIATERTIFAMPETTIGFFPDVGGSFFLPRLDGEIGTHLALTSERLHGVQAFYAGIATHYIDSSVLTALTTRLSELQFRDYASLPDRLKLVNDTLSEFTSGLPSPNDFPEAQHGNVTGNLRKAIDRCYAFDSIEEILSALGTESQSTAPNAMPEWAKSTLSTIMTRSPTSLKVTLQQLRLGRKWDIHETFLREHNIASRFMSHPDFVEGVTARLMKPRRDPRWNPSRLEDVSSKDLASFFNPPGGAESRLQLFKPSPPLPGSNANALDPRYMDYPHKGLALPREEWIKGVVGEAAWKRRDVVDEVVKRCGGKLGVREKVEDVLDRKTVTEEDGTIRWVD